MFASRLFRGSTAAFLLPGCAGLIACVPAASAAPDLRAASVQVNGSTAAYAAGSTLEVRSTVRNAGRDAAGRSTTRFYLSSDPAESGRQRKASREHPRTSTIDALLSGDQPAGTLGGGRTTSAQRVRVTIPETLASGRYTLLACADDRGDVTERDEANQCVAARKRVEITADGALPGEFRSVNSDLTDATDALLTQRGDYIRSMGCVAPVKGKAPKSAKAALASIRKQLQTRVGAAAYSAFLASPDAATSRGAALSALASAAEGNLGAALAATTRAAELSPRNADALRNAAALATSAGMPLEALALVKAAARADQSTPLAGGIDRRAAGAQIRGMALLQLGRGKDAGSAFAAAAKLDPALAMEAASGEAAQQLCAAGTSAALAKLRRGTQRRAPGTTPSTPDLSKGRASHLRRIELPGTPAEAVRLTPRYREVLDGQNAEVSELHRASGDNSQAQWARKLSPVQKRREKSIHRRITEVFKQPGHVARKQAMLEQRDRPTLVWDDFWGHTGSGIDANGKYQAFSRAASGACKGVQSGPCWEAAMREVCTPGLRGQHQQWLAEVRATRELADAYFSGISRDVTALAAQLSDPLSREEIRIELAQLELSLLTEELDAWNWGKKLKIHERTCVQSPLGETPPPTGTGTDVSGPASIDPGVACNEVSKNISFVIDPGKLLEGIRGAKELPKLPKLKASCDRIQVSYEFGKSSWAQPFVQIDWKFRAGTVTAFAGMRGKVEMTGHAEKVKAGLYLTASKEGVEDFGWRLSPSVESQIGPVLEATVKHDYDISFVPALKDAGALLGQ